MKSKKKKLLLSILINFFFAFTIIIFGPYEIFISNSSYFSFTFKDFWFFLVIVFGIYIIVSTFVFYFLPSKLNYFCNVLVFSFTLCCYIQAMFLNNNMETLLGQEIKFSINVIVINISIWLAVFSLIFIISNYHSEILNKIMIYISSALTLMQLTALVSLLLTTNVLHEEKNGYISSENMFILSPKNNTVVFLLDYFDGRTMDSILQEDEDFLVPLTGFTYFPNAISIHSRTYPSITYLLTGNRCYYNYTPDVYVDNAWENSTFFSTLDQNKINIGVYTFDNYVGKTGKDLLSNYVSSKLSLDFKATIKHCLQMVLYRDLPYLLKPLFFYDEYEINNNIVQSINLNSNNEYMQGVTQIPSYEDFNDEWFFEELEENGLMLSNDFEGAFRFYHLGACHLNLSNPIPFGKRSFEIIYKYIDYLKELNIYDDTTIIITTDHGYSGGNGLENMPHSTAVPIFFVKPTSKDVEPLKISDAPISHTDFIPTVLDSFSLNYSEYGKTVFDINKDEIRTRYYYHTVIHPEEDGEIELREFKIIGDARNKNSYHFTGKVWPILYSENDVYIHD